MGTPSERPMAARGMKVKLQIVLIQFEHLKKSVSVIWSEIVNFLSRIVGGLQDQTGSDGGGEGREPDLPKTPR